MSNDHGNGAATPTGAWLATSLTLLSSPPGSTSKSLGTFYLALSLSMIVLVAAASFGKLGPALVLVAGSARFVLAGLFEILGGASLEHAAAIVGFVLAGTALYSALATIVEDVQGQIKLPLGRRAKARDALEGPFDSQLEKLEHEAGVRQQL